MLVKYAGEEGSSCLLRALVSISNPLDPSKTIRRLRSLDGEYVCMYIYVCMYVLLRCECVCVCVRACVHVMADYHGGRNHIAAFFEHLLLLLRAYVSVYARASECSFPHREFTEEEREGMYL